MTGAAILVALVVLIVPELLSGPRHPAHPASTATSEPPVRSYTLPLIDGASGAVGQAAASGAVPQSQDVLQADESPGPGQSPEAPAGAPAVAPVGAAAPAGAVAREAPAAHGAAALHEPAPGHEAAVSHEKPGAHGAPVARESPAVRSGGTRTHGWSVQVGSFASRSNADRLVSALKRKGYGAFVSETSSRGRKWYRVRVGPERDRAAAAAVARRLRAAGHGGEIIPPR